MVIIKKSFILALTALAFASSASARRLVRVNDVEDDEVTIDREIVAQTGLPPEGREVKPNDSNPLPDPPDDAPTAGEGGEDGGDGNDRALTYYYKKCSKCYWHHYYGWYAYCCGYHYCGYYYC